MMRCRFCGSSSLHSDTQHKVFSPGKAAAGAVVFGAVGAAAGFIGKEKQGYRCAACGNFMDIPMDTFTGMQIDNAIRAAKKGDVTLYNYFKNQYPNIETVTAPVQTATAAPAERAVTAPTETLGQEETVKRSYRYGLWSPDAPVYVESVVLKTDGKEDRMSLVAWNQSGKEIRSLYLNVVVFDDTGDEVSRCRCVYQNITKNEDEPKRLPVDKTFPLNTDVAYRVQIEQEKAAFADGSTWRTSETDKVYTLPEQPVLTEENFPRIQYVHSKYAFIKFHPLRGQPKPKIRLNMPIQEEGFWMCDCGHPAKKDNPCPYCRNEYWALEKLYSQQTLLAEQQKAVRTRAEERTKKMLSKYEQLVEAKETAEKDAKYWSAQRLMQSRSISDIQKAKSVLAELSGWRDADEIMTNCDRKIEQIKAQEKKDQEEAERRAAEEAKRQEEERIASEQRKKKAKIVGIIVEAIAVVAIILAVLTFAVFIPNAKHNKAMELYNAGKYMEACSIFARLGNYKESDQYLKECWDYVAVHNTIAAGYWHTVGLKSDGTVIAIAMDYNRYGQCDVSGWTDIVAIEAGNHHTVGLRSDGTVVAVGDNNYGECDVSDWTDIVAIAAGSYHTIGLRSDGTVIAVGDNDYGECDVSDWTDVVAIAGGLMHTVGLRSDGTVIAVGGNYSGQCDVSNWTDIVAIAAGGLHTVGLRSDGTVIAVGDNDYGVCDVSDWTDIVAVAAGNGLTIGLRSDGTVIAVGDNDHGACGVSDWADIVAIAAGKDYTAGLKSDGTVVAVGLINYVERDVSDWKNIKLPNR